MTAYEPDSHLAFEVTAGPVRPVGDYRFEPVDDGTEVTLKLSAGLSGLKKLLMTKPVQQSMNSEVAALDRAKEILENQALSPYRRTGRGARFPPPPVRHAARWSADAGVLPVGPYAVRPGCPCSAG